MVPITFSFEKLLARGRIRLFCEETIVFCPYPEAMELCGDSIERIKGQDNVLTPELSSNNLLAPQYFIFKM